jgi:hypothetical protein
VSQAQEAIGVGDRNRISSGQLRKICVSVGAASASITMTACGVSSIFMAVTVMRSASAASAAAAESSSDGHRDLSNFTGARWAGTLAETDTCAGKATRHTIDFSGTFIASESSRLQTTDATGCEFDFDVSVYTGTLSSGPVSCGPSQAGAATPMTVTAYTITSTDGVTLTGSVSGTRIRDGNDCTFVSTILATR